MVGIVLIGQSNSGKSAMGKTVAEQLGIRYISSGDIARSMVDIQDDLNSGEMAPEGVMRYMILRNITSCNISYILDGFPRFTEQYEWLRDAINHELVFVHVSVPDRDVLERAKLRGRYDDGSIKKKMDYFAVNTIPMIREIFTNTLHDVYIIDNGNHTSIDDNINRLKNIVEDYIC
jgi:adenylate kinase family enzyme